MCFIALRRTKDLVVVIELILHALPYLLERIDAAAGIVRAQQQTERFTYGDSSLTFVQSYTDVMVYISTTVTISNNIPAYVAKLSWLSVVLLLHLTITVLQARTLLKGKLESVQPERENSSTVKLEIKVAQDVKDFYK